MRYEVGLRVESVRRPGNRNSLLKALLEFAAIDNDFNGNNGNEYLWDRAKGYKCNATYEVAYLRREFKDKSDEDVVKQYFEDWLGHDSYYYEYNTDVSYNKKGHVSAVAVAYTTD